jgi:hypothetical protein
MVRHHVEWNDYVDGSAQQAEYVGARQTTTGRGFLDQK